MEHFACYVGDILGALVVFIMALFTRAVALIGDGSAQRALFVSEAIIAICAAFIILRTVQLLKERGSSPANLKCKS